MRSGGIYGFFCELRRRKVYRGAAGYAVVAWLIIQVVATVFPVLGLPTWSLRFIVLMVLAGFPMALMLAWAFDMGPAGVKKTIDDPVDPECPPAFWPRRRNVIVLVCIGAAISALAGYFLMP